MAPHDDGRGQIAKQTLLPSDAVNIVSERAFGFNQRHCLLTHQTHPDAQEGYPRQFVPQSGRPMGMLHVPLLGVGADVYELRRDVRVRPISDIIAQ
jgi:hypothetical protein